MKVLYLGHYREGTGWAQAAQDYILAMDSVGIDVVCRNIQLTHKYEDVPERILELEQNSYKDCDVCIQHVLPHHLVGTKRFKKNIAYFVSESTSIKPTSWFNHLQTVDQVWVPNQELLSGLVSDNLFPDEPDRVKLVPHTFSMDKYQSDNTFVKGINQSGMRQYRPMHIQELDYKFKFYYVGDLNDRKNIESIVTAFHSEFDTSEPVGLILKVKKFGLLPEQIESITRSMCDTIKGKLRMYKDLSEYHQEAIIPVEMSEEDICSLHHYGDCFVCVSHGEGWSIPSFEAMCFGSTPICSDTGGPQDFISDDPATGTLIGGTRCVCDCEDSAFPELFTGREEWFLPSESELKKAMRYYYENHGKLDPTAGIRRAKKFSYKSVGNQIKEILEN